MRVLYGLNGLSTTPEEQLDHLSGYGGSRPVRIGNAAHCQDQFDILGAIVDCIYQHTRSRDSLGNSPGAFVVHAVETPLRCWHWSDHSIWETQRRGQSLHILEGNVLGRRRPRGQSRRASRRDPESRALVAGRDGNPRRRLRACSRCQRALYAVLRLHGAGCGAASSAARAVPAIRDPRLRVRVDSIADDLAEDGLIRRYRTDTTHNGLGKPEASFTLCSFYSYPLSPKLVRSDGHESCERLVRPRSQTPATRPLGGGCRNNQLYGAGLGLIAGMNADNRDRAVVKKRSRCRSHGLLARDLPVMSTHDQHMCAPGG